jgi:hypothetical protein
MFAFAHVVDFFPNELASLRAGGFPGAFVPARAFQCFFFGHGGSSDPTASTQRECHIASRLCRSQLLDGDRGHVECPSPNC